MAQDSIYEFPPNLQDELKKQYNLDQPRRLDEALNILEHWIKKQQHFGKVDFSRNFLERCLINCKGSVEKTKKNLDSMCTLRSMMPQFFEDFDFESEEFKKLFEVLNVVALPKMTEDYHRIFMLKLSIQQADKQLFTSFYKYSFSFCDYWRAHDYLNGFIVILDYRDMSISDYIASLDLNELRLATTMYIEGYKTRVKGIHILTNSTMIQMVVRLLKQGVSHKVRDRFYVHNTLEQLHEVVPKDLLPEEYGGKERSIKKLQDDWIKVLNSKEHRDYMKQMQAAVTNETLRPKDSENDYLGLSGSFRTMVVD